MEECIIYFMVSHWDPYCHLLFHTHLCELFHFLEDLDIASYADDTTNYTIYTVNKKKQKTKIKQKNNNNKKKFVH